MLRDVSHTFRREAGRMGYGVLENTFHLRIYQPGADEDDPGGRLKRIFAGLRLFWHEAGVRAKIERDGKTGRAPRRYPVSEFQKTA